MNMPTTPQTGGAASKSNYKTTLNLPQTSFAMEAKLVHNEPTRLKQWQDMGLYEKILASRAAAGKGRWVLHDGPPFANGDIHIGHLINKTLKDVIIRFRTMEGYEAPYVPGWDCHGLPIEHKIQEIHKNKFREMSKLDVRKECHAYAQKHADAQSLQFQRLGILGEWNNPYLTMGSDYEAETLEVFARFVEAGLVYKQLKPVPWSVASQTALADAELEYIDVEDQSVYVEFPVADGTDLAAMFDKPAYFLVWTTTPWTLPANLAIAVHPKVDYVCVEYTRCGQRRMGIIARELQAKVFELVKDAQDVVVLPRTITGEELAKSGAYTHPFIAYRGPIVLADYVTTTDGTGLVHTAPGHGEDDYETGMRCGLTIYSPVLASGKFDETAPAFIVGKSTKEANGLITEHLRQAGRLLVEQKIVHSYPHDWRTRTPILFRATEQWFIAIDKPFVPAGQTGQPRSLRSRAQDACRNQIQFIPAWGQARILGMLESRPDWCISRQRAWGLPIPVFYDEQGKALLTADSVRAVARHFRQKGSDSWFTDAPAEILGGDFANSPEFGPIANLRKEKDIFDVWFESGSSWRTVLQCRSYLKYPCDLYLEGSDQHRGWFQLSSLAALGATGQVPFKQVLTHGFAVKPDGTKWSKREQDSNPDYPHALKMVNEFGADVLRLWCCSMDYEGDMAASKTSAREFGDKYRKIRNTLRYLLSNLYDFNPHADSQPIPTNSLDGWALAQLDTLIVDARAAYESYQLHRVFRLLHDFCSVQISAVYGNAMKDRLYCEAAGSSLRRRSQTVMHQMVLALAKLLAPICVYTADEAWEHIQHRGGADAALESVHLALLPEPSGTVISDAQREEWKLLMDLRDAALGQLDKITRQAGKYKALDAEVIFEVDDADLRRRLEAYGCDLEDLVGAGCYSFAGRSAPDAPAVAVKVLDRRSDYRACARSWKRRRDVGSDARYPDLCARDAAVVAAG